LIELFIWAFLTHSTKFEFEGEKKGKKLFDRGIEWHLKDEVKQLVELNCIGE